MLNNQAFVFHITEQMYLKSWALWTTYVYCILLYHKILFAT